MCVNCMTEYYSSNYTQHICKKSPGRSIRHHALNDMVARTLSGADIPSSKKPQGLCRSDGKRPVLPQPPEKPVR